MSKISNVQNFKDFTKVLKRNGYEFLRNTQESHRIFSNGNRKITVPFTSNNPMLFRRLIKEYGLKCA